MTVVRSNVYITLLRAPGVARLAGAFLALGVAGTMTPVAFVLFARAATHSFSTASLVLGASTAGGLVFGPARGRLVDRAGPRRAILWLVLPDVATDAAFIIAGHSRAAAPALVALAFVAGAVSAPAGTALRTVWSETLARQDARHAGYAVMSMLQETSWIGGPLLAGLIIAAWSPTAAVAATAVLSFAGAVAFAAGQRVPGRPEEGSRSSDGGRLPALRGAGIRTVVATAAGFGLTFGVLDVAFPAYARTHGSAAAAGVLLSAFAAGSWVGGFVYGLRPRGHSAGAQYPRVCLLATAGMAPLIAAPGLAAMVALAALSGLCYAPVSTSQLAVIDEVAPPGHKAEAFTWLGTLYGTGTSLGAALAGQLISGAGDRAALAAACAATLAACLIATARGRTLRPPDGFTQPAPEPAPEPAPSVNAAGGDVRP